MNKPRLDTIANIPMAPKIPTLAEEWNWHLIIIVFNDDSISTYEFDRGPSEEQHFASPEEFIKSHGDLPSSYNINANLSTTIKRHVPGVKSVYYGEL